MTRQNGPNIGPVQARLLFWFGVFSQRVSQDPVLKLLYISLIAGRMHTYFSSKNYIYICEFVNINCYVMKTDCVCAHVLLSVCERIH